MIFDMQWQASNFHVLPTQMANRKIVSSVSYFFFAFPMFPSFVFQQSFSIFEHFVASFVIAFHETFFDFNQITVFGSQLSDNRKIFVFCEFELELEIFVVFKNFLFDFDDFCLNYWKIENNLYIFFDIEV